MIFVAYVILITNLVESYKWFYKCFIKHESGVDVLSPCTQGDITMT
jgi:hypothetical protein